MTTLCDGLVKIGARIVRHGRSITFQMAGVMVSRGQFRQALDPIADLAGRELPRLQWKRMAGSADNRGIVGSKLASTTESTRHFDL